MILTTAASIMEAIDPAVDPCDDFFQYACGTWNQKHIIPDDRPNYNTFRKLGDDLHVTLKSKCHCYGCTLTHRPGMLIIYSDCI